MNLVSKVSFFVEELFKMNPVVNTTTFIKTVDMDLNKENIYPLVNIDIQNMTVSDQLVYINYEITILEQRDISPVSNNDKMFGSNLIDNLNESSYIAIKFINAITRTDNENNINIDNISDIEFIKNERENGLDGCRFYIELSIYNNISGC